jgi:hypothetical protein
VHSVIQGEEKLLTEVEVVSLRSLQGHRAAHHRLENLQNNEDDGESLEK